MRGGEICSTGRSDGWLGLGLGLVIHPLNSDSKGNNNTARENLVRLLVFRAEGIDR
ncbi:hypothetical protein BY996DRAFT_6533707 [Phakopsora pachyrhizi]|nr:hypothetical protein BY996DRAFT_6533707 [Phakopsora pachyrhizi]